MKHLHPVGLLLSCSCFLLCLCVITPVVAHIRHQAEALVNWKASLDGADESLGPWSMANSTSLCRWTHITCNSAGLITELDFIYTSLKGTLDEFDFSAFPHLKKLILFQNGLYGTIPAGIGNLTSLVELKILNNPYMWGAIPHSIGQLKHLALLRLATLRLGGTLPVEIGNLTRLEELYLQQLSLSGSIPLTIGMLVKLQVVHLGSNNLTGSIPLEIGNMTELEEFNFSDNFLEGQLPGTLSHLTNLYYMFLQENQLQGHIFPELVNSSLLYNVNIEKNNFSGMFPSSICLGRPLLFLNAGYNGFTGIHHQIFQNCTSLEYLDFRANNIVADLSDWFRGHPKRLTAMAFSQNQLYGTLLTDRGEDFLCNLTNLNFLDLSNNALHGEFSKCLWDLPNLRFLDLSSNNFSGVVPFSATYGAGLNHLRLADNHFQGTFPLGLKNCKSLVTLDLGDNNFSGTIPSWVSMSLPELDFLRLSANIFDGIIPREILQFRQLQVLDLSNNKLIGPVPDDFTNFTGMAQEQRNIDPIYSNNDIYQVQIHIVWKNVDYVYTIAMRGMLGIDLSGNFLSQEIPGGLTTLLGVRYLNLSGNHLSGCIPEDIGNLVLLESLDLSRNQLWGEIPPSFAGLKSISTLNLSTNALSGRIPMGDQLQTLDNPSIYSNNPGLCGFPLEECVDSSAPTWNEVSQDEDKEALWLYCFVAAGFIFGFWLYWGIFLFRSETWRCAFYQHVDGMQAKVTKKIYNFMSRFQADGSE